MTDQKRTPSDHGLEENIKKLRKLERHFSDEVLEKLNYEDLTKIKKRNLTIVFWDIENSSELSDMLMAADIAYSELVQTWYKTISEIIFEFDGSLDKFIGDGTMAIFCIPNKDPEGKQDAINAVSASLKAREGFERVRQEWNEKWSGTAACISPTSSTGIAVFDISMAPSTVRLVGHVSQSYQ